MADPFLNPETLARIDNFNIVARNLVEGFISGLHKGLFHGFGTEFVHYKAYNKGDDLKYVDWKAYTRSRKMQLKVFREETNCNCYIVMDTSSSMGYVGNGRVGKLHYAKMVAASIAYLVNRQSDNVGFFAYDDTVRSEVRPGHRSGQVHRICVELARLKAANTADHSRILNYLGEHFNRRGLIVMISDFLDFESDLMRSLRVLRAAHHDVLLIQILDDDEIDFNFQGGNVRFIDSEGDGEMVTTPTLVRERYREAIQRFLKKLEDDARRNDIDYLRLTCSQPLENALASYLHRREAFR